MSTTKKISKKKNNNNHLTYVKSIDFKTNYNGKNEIASTSSNHYGTPINDIIKLSTGDLCVLTEGEALIFS